MASSLENEFKNFMNKVKKQGGWTKELVDLYNKYAPEGMFQMDYDFLTNKAE